MEVGSKEEDYALFLDYTDMGTTSDVHGKVDTTGRQQGDTEIDKKDKWLADLIQINQDQRDSIDKLVKELDAISLSGQASVPYMGTQPGYGQWFLPRQWFLPCMGASTVIGDIPLKSVSHKNMSYADLVLGMSWLAKYLQQSGGNVSAYLSHMSFIARQAYLDCFVDNTFIEYDRVVTDAVIRGDIATYIPGYPLAQALAFHSANHNPQVGKTKGKWVPAKRKSNIANEVCYNYNFHSCGGCERLHVCKQCRANHKFANCPTKSRDQQ